MRSRCLVALLVLSLSLAGCRAKPTRSNWSRPYRNDVSALSISPAAGVMALAGPNGVVSVRAVKDGSPLKTLSAEVTEPRFLKFSPDGTALAMAGKTGTRVAWWDLQGGEVVAVVDPGSSVAGIGFVDSHTLATCTEAGIVHYWDTEGRMTQHLAIERSDGVEAGLSPWANALAVSGGGLLQVMGVPGGELLYRSENGPHAMFTWSPYGDYLAYTVAAPDARLEVMSLDSGELAAVLEGGADSVRFSSDNRYLARVSASGVEMYDLRTNTSLGTVALSGILEAVPLKKQLLLTRRKGSVDLWNLDHPAQPVWTLSTPTRGWVVAPVSSRLVLLTEEGKLEGWTMPRD